MRIQGYVTREQRLTSRYGVPSVTGHPLFIQSSQTCMFVQGWHEQWISAIRQFIPPISNSVEIGWIFQEQLISYCQRYDQEEIKIRKVNTYNSA